MTDIENYKNIVEKIFGRTFDIPLNGNTNNCIGAINSRSNFAVFTDNFIVRLQ